MAARIAVIGNINCDFVFRVPRLPRPGETLAGSAFFTAAGGKGANQAVAAARLGAQVSFVGCVGADTTGADMPPISGPTASISAADRSCGGHGLGVIMVQDSARTHRGRLRANSRSAQHRRAPSRCRTATRPCWQEMRIDRQRGDLLMRRVSGDSDPAPAREDLPAAWREVDAESQRDGGRIDFEQPRLMRHRPGGGGSAPAAQGPKAVAPRPRPGIFRRRRCWRRLCPHSPEAVDSPPQDATRRLAVACEGASLVEAARFGTPGRPGGHCMGAQPPCPLGPRWRSGLASPP